MATQKHGEGRTKKMIGSGAFGTAYKVLDEKTGNWHVEKVINLITINETAQLE